MRTLNEVPEPDESTTLLKSEFSSRDSAYTNQSAALPTLTTAQHKVLNAIENSVAARGYPPSLRELADAVDLAKTTTEGHLDALVRKGFLRRDAGEDRGMCVLRPSSEARVIEPMPLKKAHLCDRCRREMAPCNEAPARRRVGAR